MSGIRFLPWVRAGLSAGFPSMASLPARGHVTVTLALGGDFPAGSTVTREVHTHGPGDVLGLDSQQVLRRFPAPDTDGAETTGFACVELDNPDAPWAFTTGGPDADGRLRPWLVLVVVPAATAELTHRPGTPLPVLTCPTEELPPLADSWAWAHAQLTVTTASESVDQALASAERSLSRLVCPRRLEADTDYVAALVPAFRAGALAGLGQSLGEHESGDLADAWATGGTGPLELPVYDSWRFSTGAGGDFETLVRRLEARPTPETVGRRDMYVGAADPALPQIAEDQPGGLLGLEGALRAPSARPSEWPAAARAAHRSGMRALLQHPDRLTPPLYGGQHAGADRVPSDGSGPEWLRELNLDPRHRVAAALGTQVVRDHQEELAEAAWTQAASLRQANDLLRQAQLARAVSQTLHARRLTEDGPGRPLAEAEVLGLTDAVASAVPVVPRRSGSVGGLIAGNIGLAAVDSNAFRRIARPRGPVAKHARSRALAAPVTQLASTELTKRPTLEAPKGTVSLPALAAPTVQLDVKTFTTSYLKALSPWWHVVPAAPAPPIVEPDTRIASAPGVFVLDDRFFAASEDGRVFEVRWIGGTWVWRDHGRPPGGHAASSVSAAIGRRVFVATRDGRLCSLYWDGDRWLWQDHGRPSGTNVVGGAATVGSSVVVTCSNGSVAELRSDGWGGWSWHDRGRVPARKILFLTLPAQSAVGRLGGVINSSVFVVSDTLGELWELELGSGTWRCHGTPDGKLVPGVSPSMLSSKLFVTTVKGDLWERYLGTNGWQWVTHGRPGQAVVSAPGAPMLNAKLFVRTSDGGVAERAWNGSAWVWVGHGKPPGGASILDQPDAPVQSHTFFCAATDGKLWARWYGPHGWEWVDHDIPKDSGGQGAHHAPPSAEDRWRPRLAMFGSAVVAHLDNPGGDNRVYHRVGRDLGLSGQVSGGWTPAGNPIAGPQLGPEGRGLGVAVADINGNGRPDLVVLTVEPGSGGCNARYWIGWNLDANGVPTGGWTGPKHLHSQLNPLVTEADIALADLDGDGRPELVLAYAVSGPGRPTQLYYRVGWRLDTNGDVRDGWSESKPIPWDNVGVVRGIGVDIADLDDNDRADLALLVVEDRGGVDRAHIRVGHALNRRGNITGGWSDPRPVGGGPLAPKHAGAGLSVVDITGSRKPDLVCLLLVDGQTDNQGRIRIGLDADAHGAARTWTGDQVVPHWFGWENQGAALAVVDLDPALTQRRNAMGMAFNIASQAHQDYLAPAQSLARTARDAVVDVSSTARRIVAALDPATTVPAATLGRVVIGGRRLPQRAPSTSSADVQADPLRPVVRGITFPQPTYELLRRISQEHIVPGVEHIPPDSLTLLRANPTFIEAFLTGLNHELSRELLWREVPVDLRTTWFRQFWDIRGTVGATPDIPPLTSWRGPLGTHATGVGASGEGNLVLVVRGELLRRYPSTTVAMRPAVWTDGSRTSRTLGEQALELAPTFSGWLSPDLLLFGFPLTVTQARGSATDAGWFVLLREQATAVRFGVDDPPDDPADWAHPPQRWSDLHWAHLVGAGGVGTTRFAPVAGTVADGLTLDGATFARNSAHLARALMQQPVEIAVHAGRMLPPQHDGWQVSAVERAGRRIVALHGRHADDTPWRLELAQVADALAHGDAFYVQQPGAGRSPLVVVDRADGSRHVRTRGDAHEANNLDALPEVQPA